jgi:competence protein ComEA
MDRRVAGGFLLAGVALAVALIRVAADHRGRAGPPAWKPEGSFAGVIEVGGAVRRSGVLLGQAGRRARDAVELAGPRVPPRGRGAETCLREGDALTLLPDGSVRVARMPGERLVALGRRIDLNLATAEDLTSLPGIGPTAASRIVAWRASRGRYDRLEDLRRIPGIGPKTLARIRPFLLVAPPASRARSR